WLPRSLLGCPASPPPRPPPPSLHDALPIFAPSPRFRPVGARARQTVAADSVSQLLSCSEHLGCCCVGFRRVFSLCAGACFLPVRSEERRVGKVGGSGWWTGAVRRCAAGVCR